MRATSWVVMLAVLITASGRSHAQPEEHFPRVVRWTANGTRFERRKNANGSTEQIAVAKNGAVTRRLFTPVSAAFGNDKARHEREKIWRENDTTFQSSEVVRDGVTTRTQIASDSRGSALATSVSSDGSKAVTRFWRLKNGVNAAHVEHRDPSGQLTLRRTAFESRRGKATFVDWDVSSGKRSVTVHE